MLLMYNSMIILNFWFFAIMKYSLLDKSIIVLRY